MTHDVADVVQAKANEILALFEGMNVKLAGNSLATAIALFVASVLHDAPDEDEGEGVRAICADAERLAGRLRVRGVVQ